MAGALALVPPGQYDAGLVRQGAQALSTQWAPGAQSARGRGAQRSTMLARTSGVLMGMPAYAILLLLDIQMQYFKVRRITACTVREAPT
jgi:hypothetical protein